MGEKEKGSATISLWSHVAITSAQLMGDSYFMGLLGMILRSITQRAEQRAQPSGKATLAGVA